MFTAISIHMCYSNADTLKEYKFNEMRLMNFHIQIADKLKSVVEHDKTACRFLSKSSIIAEFWYFSSQKFLQVTYIVRLETVKLYLPKGNYY